MDHENGEPDGGRLGPVRPDVEGTDLATRLRSGPLPLGEAARVGHSLAEALAALHNEGVHHGPISPEDVILTADGNTRLAHPVAGSTADPEQVPTNYAAPEQLDDPVATSATDMYSLGVLLYEMVVGSPPYPNWDERVVAEQKLRDLPAPPSAGATLVPAAFDDLVLQLLDPRAIARPSAAEAAAALRRLEVPVLAGPAPAVPRTTSVTTIVSPERRSWAPWIATGVVLALLATGLIVWLVARDDESTRTVPAVVGLTSADAIAELRNQGFKVSSTSAPFNGVAVDVVAKQSPAAGVDLRENGTVAITISTGPPVTTAPPIPPIIVNPTSNSTSSSTSSSTTSTTTTTTTTTPPP
ncbi:MAG: PASTA domain-containing protein [Acidimicrobiia bacterium]|nr:PASTA domain-containing protein [Acidimicrobiia bacterium]